MNIDDRDCRILLCQGAPNSCWLNECVWYVSGLYICMYLCLQHSLYLLILSLLMSISGLCGVFLGFPPSRFPSCYT